MVRFRYSLPLSISLTDKATIFEIVRYQFKSGMDNQIMKYTKEFLEPIVKDSLSFAEVIRKIGLVQSGGTHYHLKSRILKFGINTSHFLGRIRNSGPSHVGGPPRMPDSMLFVKNCQHISAAKRRAKERIPELCMACGLGLEWQGKPLVLRLDHINGNRYDYSWENLRKLCPNCDSQTDTFCGRNLKKKFEHNPEFAKQFSKAISKGLKKVACPARWHLKNKIL